MCGIFGIISSNQSLYSKEFLTKSLKQLAILSETRGKDSSGLCTFNQVDMRVYVFKGPIPIINLLKQKEIKNAIFTAFSNGDHGKYAFGHARLVTNGTQLNDSNNQPVIKDGVIGVHNGIVVNVDELWGKHNNITRENEIDTEVLLALVRAELDAGKSIEEAVSKSINKVFGTVATALAFENLNKFALATNNGSLYTIHNNKDILFFASERFILSEFERKIDISQIGDYELKQITSNTGIIVDLDHFKINEFSFDQNFTDQLEPFTNTKYEIDVTAIKSEKEQLSTVVDLNFIHLNPKAEKEQSFLEYPIEKIKTLKRCTKCLLPETFPFIHYDQKGACNYCKNYKKKNQAKPLEELHRLLDPYRKTNNKIDVLVPYSGGRDSTYVLHTVKKVLGLNPLTYTYDWGMVTDLARRNVARTCGKLGIENIIVAANMHRKRENIRKNISAWLKNPTLGMIPLFMAGDKYFFYYCNLISKQNDLRINIWGANPLENTDFKTGFCGLEPCFNKKRIDSIKIKDKIKLSTFFLKNFYQTPDYINSSLFDTTGSFLSRYILKRQGYFQLFDYMRWDENTINNTIIDNYEWEKAVDTKSTWRIGDGTASFYNYIYTLVAGFSENDTFRSNQIREGMISRDKALKLIYTENRPRYNSLKWYLEILGLNYESTIRRINNIPRNY